MQAIERNNLTGLHVSVIGAARSGVAAARCLVHAGALVTLSDSRSESSLGAAATEARSTGASCIFDASLATAIPSGSDLVVTSPGVPANAEVLKTAQARGIPIWSEIELAYRITDAPIAAVTGTNGKTTTTLLLAAMLREASLDASVCGNISADDIKKTLVEAAVEARGTGAVLVAEISSFQLEWVDRFAPRVAVLTNITADHLNRHSSFEEYAETKARLFSAQSAGDWAVIGFDNEASREIGKRGRSARTIWFTTACEAPAGEPCAWVDDGHIVVRLSDVGDGVRIMAISETPSTLPGVHSVANVLAAAGGAMALGAPPEAVRRAVVKFPGVPHRMELVADIDGIRFVNNSMCTNVAAAVCSLQAMDRPTVVIAGGADKGLDFEPLTEALRAHAKHLILIGTAADKMEQTFRAGGYHAIVRADSLEAAVEEGRHLARHGDAVMLSPSCASFDMFRDFEARGAAFRCAVRQLEKRP